MYSLCLVDTLESMNKLVWVLNFLPNLLLFVLWLHVFFFVLARFECKFLLQYSAINLLKRNISYIEGIVYILCME